MKAIITGAVMVLAVTASGAAQSNQELAARSTLARIWRNVAMGVAESHSRNVRWRRAATQISLTRARLPLS
jgi:hypothetical protein